MARSKLESWAKASTWHTSHALDIHRFFEFIDQYAKDHGHTVEESALKDLIASITNTPTGNDNTLEEIIRERVALMVAILDFLKVTGR
jgi:hemerythrin-like domain-containing protein